jgi:hypothetical protein
MSENPSFVTYDSHPPLELEDMREYVRQKSGVSGPGGKVGERQIFSDVRPEYIASMSEAESLDTKDIEEISGMTSSLNKASERLTAGGEVSSVSVDALKNIVRDYAEIKRVIESFTGKDSMSGVDRMAVKQMAMFHGPEYAQEFFSKKFLEPKFTKIPPEQTKLIEDFLSTNRIVKFAQNSATNPMLYAEEFVDRASELLDAWPSFVKEVTEQYSSKTAASVFTQNFAMELAYGYRSEEGIDATLDTIKHNYEQILIDYSQLPMSDYLKWHIAGDFPSGFEGAKKAIDKMIELNDAVSKPSDIQLEAWWNELFKAGGDKVRLEKGITSLRRFMITSRSSTAVTANNQGLRSSEALGQLVDVDPKLVSFALKSGEYGNDVQAIILEGLSSTESKELILLAKEVVQTTESFKDQFSSLCGSQKISQAFASSLNRRVFELVSAQITTKDKNTLKQLV